ncbi:MAG TPA: DNA-3-methyladenine glycosylase I [Thermoanaerobaculia bacterium]|nr:DNA-3-methyladenine glycosylase I [Thermoanaerobaculia bacterium]
MTRTDFPDGRPRCGWVSPDPLYVEYHDREWGVPLRDRRALFEALVLDGAQAGLSWLTILKRREGYRRAFEGFDIERVAAWGPAEIEARLADPGIIRNRAKVVSAVGNARAVLALEEEGHDFVEWMWSFTGGGTLDHRLARHDQVPAVSPESEAMAKELKRRGFRFCGPTICYALMQATGMINDHLTGCFRYPELAG